jgi:multimeric flavodoxin WrbA
MKITILNGNPDAADNGFDGYLARLAEKLEAGGHETVLFTLRDMDIRYCTGCFGCWGKTPGTCSMGDDDSVQIRKDIIASGLMIFASPVIMGFTSSLLKKAQDKLVPLVLPYIGIYQGEQHHDPRYEHYPLTGILLQPEEDTDDEDLSIIDTIYRRLVINFHSKVVFSRLTTEPVEEVIDEINCL